MRKFLVICSALDLTLPRGATPWLWQLYKALYELHCDLIVVPYEGRAIRSLWWRCYKNPCRLEGDFYAKIRRIVRRSIHRNDSSRNSSESLTPKLARTFALPKWKRLVGGIISRESDIDGVLFIQVPLNQIKGFASSIKREFGIPSFYYETDVPTSLPEYGGFYFNHFPGADLSEFDAFIIPSEGCRKRLIEMGAGKVFVLHFGVDPSVYSPVETDRFIDVFFSGNGSRNREKAIESLIAVPSKKVDANFVVSGSGYEVDLGNTKRIPSVPFSSWRKYCCASQVNLNIPRENHALTYATSTSRPFELTAMKCCVVSSKYLGLEKWFDLRKEVLVAENSEEAIELYRWLLSDEEERLRLAESAYQRVLKDHTAKLRAKELLRFIDQASARSD